MNILICVYFKAPFGGLHANVFSTARHCVRRGHRVTVVCRDGPFRARLDAAGVATIATDFASIDDSVQAVLSQSTLRYDVIHAHPFASSKVALELGRRLSLPVIVTYHGMYADEIEARVDQYAAIVAVSPGIRDYLGQLVPHQRHKLVVATNGVDLELFKPSDELALPASPARPNVTLASRFDPDKRFIIDIGLRALRHCAIAHRGQVRWTIVGDGSELAAFKHQAAAIANSGELELAFSGWLHDQDLAEAYRQSDVVLAPGRCALEAMACGCPVIAIGSKEYVGLVTAASWQAGVYTNFGGLGKGLDTYRDGLVEADLSQALSESTVRATLGTLGTTLTRNFYDEAGINQQLLGLYEACAR